MLTLEQADVITDIIDAGMAGNWPNVKRHLLEELGYDPEVLLDAGRALAEITQRDPIFDEMSFR